MYADLEALIENSVYAGYELGDNNHLHVERQNIYYAAAKVGEQVYGVRFKVDIFKGNSSENGSYKDHKIAALEVEKSPLLLHAESGDDSSSSLCRSRQNGVASQNENDFFIAVPNIRQAFMGKDTTINPKSQGFEK